MSTPIASEANVSAEHSQPGVPPLAPSSSSEAPAAATPTNGAPTASTTGSGPNLAPHQSTSSLFVTDLHPSVTEAMLYEIFNMIGEVASIRVCRDAILRRSLGNGYVNYTYPADAERALEQLNYSEIKGQPCRILWSQRDPSLRKAGLGNIFVKNLDETIDSKALHDTFAAFGKIISCKVATDEQGKSKGHGFVQYTTVAAADAAIDAVNGMQLNDKVVFVGYHVSRRERQAKIDEDRNNFTNLYFKNVPLEFTLDEAKALFKQYGQVQSINLGLDENSKFLGYGFVDFQAHDAAVKAIEDLHSKDFRGQVMYLARAQKRGERDEELRKAHEQKKNETTLKYQGLNLYVKNLDDDYDDDKLRAVFEPFGTITSSKVMKDSKGTFLGYGFVCFASHEEASKALTEMNGKMLGSKPLYVSWAQPKEQRKQQLEAQMTQRAQLTNQQLAAAGIPGGPYGLPAQGGGAYPPYPGPYPPSNRNMVYAPQNAPGGPPRPRYPPTRQMPLMGMPGPYTQPPQGYPGAYPAPAGALGGAGMRGAPPVTAPAGRGAVVPGGVNGRPNAMAPPPPAGAAGPAGRGLQQQHVMPSRPGQYPGQGAVPPPMPSAAASRGPDANPAGISLALLAKVSPAEQKQMLGEALYPQIAAKEPERAGKITGMILEIENDELLHLLETPDALQAKTMEAVQVLEAYERRNEVKSDAH